MKSDPCYICSEINPDLSNRENARRIGVGETTVRRHLRANHSKISEGSPVKGSIDVTPEGAQVNNVVVEGDLNGDWSKVFDLFNLDASKFEVVDDTVKMNTWQQSKALDNGQRDIIQLYSYSARFRRVSENRIRAEVVDSWRKELQGFEAPEIRPALDESDGTYVILVADPQLGKKGTNEAVANWKNGILGHFNEIMRLEDSGTIVERIHLAFMGDEHEGVVNNYCVAADEPVLTKNLDWVPAGDLKEGDLLYSVEENSESRSGRRFQTGRVIRNEVKDLPAIKVTFSDGTTLKCTPEHPVLTRTRKSKPWEWVKAKDLVPGVHEISKVSEIWDTPDDFDTGWMGGLLDGEGCFQAASGRDPWLINVSQLPGPVLNEAKRILTANQFRFSESVSTVSGVVTLNILGGYSEVLRALGTFKPKRLLEKMGHPYLRTRNPVTVSKVEDIGRVPIAMMETSSKTYISKGIVSHNSNQPHTVELNFTRQIELDFDLRVWSIKQLIQLGLPLSVSSVISNHGEWTRNGSKDPATTRGDNSSTFVARLAKRLFDESGIDIEWHIAEEEPGIYLTLSEVPVYFTHGYIEKGRGATVEARVKNAMDEQILADPVTRGTVRVWFSAHYHHFYSLEDRGRTVFGCPALEAERSSEYMLDQFGVWSKPGMLGMVLTNSDSRGWTHLTIQ